jgi:hypothetical protein
MCLMAARHLRIAILQSGVLRAGRQALTFGDQGALHREQVTQGGQFFFCDPYHIFPPFAAPASAAGRSYTPIFTKGGEKYAKGAAKMRLLAIFFNSG